MIPTHRDVPGTVTALARSTAAMTALTAVSRVTGFVRILVVAAVLGTTYLGNTYQTANTVPNLLFELFAAGVLQAALIPTLVELLDGGRRDDAERVAGSVLGLAAVVLAGLAAVGMLAAPVIMRALVAGVSDPAVRQDQVELGTVFLLFFLPQVVFYAGGMVATAVLNAHGRFALPMFAPVVNNVVVTASYALFWWLRRDEGPSLDLSWSEIVVLAGGTTLGVVAFTAVPVVAVVRAGFSLRPRFDHRNEHVRRIARLGVWAAVFLAMSQVLLAVVLVLANRVEGGVVAYQVGFTFFLLPHALFALPVLTALFPDLSRRSQTGDRAGFAAAVATGVRTIAFFVLPATAAFVVLARPLSRLALFGETTAEGAEQVARVVAAFAPGLLGYGAFLFLTRAFAAAGDTRTPALVHVGVTVVGGALMVVGFAVAPMGWEVAAVAGAHAAAHLGGAAVLVALLRPRLADALAGMVRAVAVTAVTAGAAGLVMFVVRSAVAGGGRIGGLTETLTGGIAGAAVYLALQWTAGGVRPGDILARLRSEQR